MIAIYNGEKIEIWVLGVRHTAHGARETLETFEQDGWPTLAAMIPGLYGVKLKEQQVDVLDLNPADGNTEVMRRASGQYIAK